MPEGWRQNVLIGMSEDGRISRGQDNKPRPNDSSIVAVDTLIPGIVNLHSHSFQRAFAGLTESRGEASNDSFWTWRKRMYDFLQVITPSDLQAIAELVQMEMLEAGLTHLPVLYMQAGADGRNLEEKQARFGCDLDSFHEITSGVSEILKNAPPDCNAGIAPHSLRAVPASALKTILETHQQGPVHIHIAEQNAEVLELQEVYAARPVEWLLANVEVDKRWCFRCTVVLKQCWCYRHRFRFKCAN